MVSNFCLLGESQTLKKVNEIKTYNCKKGRKSKQSIEVGENEQTEQKVRKKMLLHFIQIIESKTQKRGGDVKVKEHTKIPTWIYIRREILPFSSLFCFFLNDDDVIQ